MRRMGTRRRSPWFRSTLKDAATISVSALVAVTMMAFLCLAQTPQPTPAVVQQEAFGQLPLYFVENRGQIDAPVSYYIQGQDKTVYFTSEGITYALSDLREPGGDQLDVESEPGAEEAVQRWVVKLDSRGESRCTASRGG